MNKKSLHVITSRRAKKASEALARDSRLISEEEKNAFGLGELELIDRTVVLKTLVVPGEEQDILSKQKNRDSRTGINDFQLARIVSEDGGGTIVVDAIKLSHAAFVAGETNDAAATKAYIQTKWPSDLENGEVVFQQNGRVIQKIKIAEFAYQGNEPVTRHDQYKRLTRPFVIAAGSDLKIKLLRPTGVAGAEEFLAIELQGMQTYPKRTRG